jgi:2-methylcitrate dehydratase PrpD
VSICASEAFAAHALGLQWRSLPAKVRDAAKAFLVDTVGVGVAGARAPYAAEVLACEANGSHGGARVFGTAATLSVRSAAFVNAFQIHAQEFDCVHEAAVLHPFSAVLGALAAECTGGTIVDGENFGAALVAGVDVAVGLGLAARGKLKFFRPATAGIFGATAALARVRALSRTQTVAAFGHALAFASGTMQAHVEGTPGLALQVAAAARNAVVSVDLAQTGVPGARMAFEGDFGYFAMFEDGQDLAPVLAGLGRHFAVTSLSHKLFPTGRAAHGGIAAVQKLATGHGVVADDIVSLRYVAPSLIGRLVGRAPHPEMRVAFARLCLPYLAAYTLRHGTVGLDAFSTAALRDDLVLELAGRISVAVDGNLEPSAFVPAWLHAVLRDGRRIDIEVTALPGSPAAPLDAPACLSKLRDCLEFAGVPLSAEDLTLLAEKLEQTRNVGELMREIMISEQP